ncbi:IucA/IucC family protein [Krasilnikovia sp. M28-CT-15]|uniref:IucA/IucC family protein n=1 Tax=Krasilnikovia sp. M28-CT-15 TaxID=3373540 RepID=UPI0038764035
MPQPTNRPTADPARTRDSLTALRPDLLTAYDVALPTARAAVLARLIGAFVRESLPGVRAVPSGAADLRWRLDDGRDMRAPAALAAPFADAPAGLTVHIGTAAHTDPGELLRTLDLPRGDRLAAELDDSVANLALARADQPAPHGGTPALKAAAGDPDGLGRLEQAVADGHPLHPCCRTRAGLDTAEVLAYAPEHRPVLRLRRLLVPPDRWYGNAPPILYAHPWQARRLLAEHPWLTDDGDTAPARPLMSLRTLAPLGGGDHVKTAVDVQMTSAVRTVSPAAVHNGPPLSALLAELTRDLPLTVLAETAAGAALVDGVPDRRLSYLRRRAPHVAPGETVVPLGALSATSPADGRPLFTEAIRDHGAGPYTWLADLAGVLVAPLLTVLHRGVALEAHGQNTLVVLHAGRPVRIVYRDLGGIRVSARRVRAAGRDCPPLHGDLPTDDDAVLRTKLAAALGTVLGELVAGLARHHGAEPARLWAVLGAAVRAAGTPDAARLLQDPLPVKATTAMRLATDPLTDRWVHLPNPLAAAA